MHVTILYNGHKDGDWMRVECDGEVVYAGHSMSPYHLYAIMQETQGFEFISYDGEYDFDEE